MAESNDNAPLRSRHGKTEMRTHVLQFGGVTIRAPETWSDIRDTLENEEAPFTFAKPYGAGALQFTIARYKGGRVPNPSGEDLLEMALDFGERNDLGTPFDEQRYDGEVTCAGASFHRSSDFVRIWHVSDGRNFVIATYVCEWEHRGPETAECERIVRTVQFKGTGAAGAKRPGAHKREEGDWTPPEAEGPTVHDGRDL